MLEITPGQWKVEWAAELPDWPTGITSPTGRIADLIVAPGWQPETVANARAIASLPDLLAACEEMLVNYGSIYPHDRDRGVRMMRIAIAKARGQEASA